MRTHPRQLPLFPYTTLFRSTDEDEGVSMSRQSHPSTRGGRRPPDLSRRALLTSTGLLGGAAALGLSGRSEEHTSELQSRGHLVCRLLLEKNNMTTLKYNVIV